MIRIPPDADHNTRTAFEDIGRRIERAQRDIDEAQAQIKVLLARDTSVVINGEQFDGTHHFADGTAAEPSITFEADPDTGVYRYAESEVGVAAGGEAAATVKTDVLSNHFLYVLDSSTPASEYIRLQKNNASSGFLLLDAGAARDFHIGTQGASQTGNLLFRTKSTQRWGIDGTDGHLYPIADSVYSIGTDALRPSRVNTRELYTDGDVVYEDTFWDDLRFPAQGINPAGSPAPPSVDTSDPFMGSLLFGASGTDVIAGVAQIPHCYKEGTDIEPHIHWCPTNTDTGDVAWRFSYQVANVGDTFPGSLTTAGIEVDAGDGTTNKHQLHDFASIDGTGLTISTIIMWKLERVGSDGTDTYNANARLLELDFHYQIDTPGSNEEYAK